MKVKNSNYKNLFIATQKFQREVDKALDQGKGRYKWTSAIDLHDYLKFIAAIKTMELKRAMKMYDEMGTPQREEIPTLIYVLLAEMLIKD